MTPHRIATWEQAICYLVDGSAETLESYDETVSSPSVTFDVPAVMRLTKQVRGTKHAIKFSRINVLTRDRFTCCYCAKKHTARELTYDHVLPRCRGGTTTFANIVASCRPCNTRKGRRTPDEAGMRMHFRPYVPKTLPIAVPFLVDLARAPEQWKPYLTAMMQAVSA